MRTSHKGAALRHEVADEPYAPTLILEHDLVGVRAELAPRCRGSDEVLVWLELDQRGCSLERGWDATNLAREILEHVGLEGHVHVDGANDVAELAAFDVEDSLDVLWRVGCTWRSAGPTGQRSGP